MVYINSRPDMIHSTQDIIRITIHGFNATIWITIQIMFNASFKAKDWSVFSFMMIISLIKLQSFPIQ